MHVIAAKAVMFHEAMAPEFRTYQENVLTNAQTLAKTFNARGFRLVSGGTDNHLMLLDLRPTGFDRPRCRRCLARDGYRGELPTRSPYDAPAPSKWSGIRPGSPSLTTRGMGAGEMVQIANWISDILLHPEDTELRETIKAQVHQLSQAFPIYEYLSQGLQS